MFRGAAWPVAALRTLFCEVPQPCHLRVRRRGGERRELWCDQFQVEGARPAELGCPLDRSRVTGKAAGLLGRAAQVGAGRGREPPVHIVEAPPSPDGCHRCGEPCPPRPVVVDIVGGDDVRSAQAGEFGEGIVTGGGEGLAVVPDLHGHVGAAKVVLQECQFGTGRRWARAEQGSCDRAFAATRQHEPVACRCRLGCLQQLGDGRRWRRGTLRLGGHGDSGKVEVGTGPDGCQEGQVDPRAPLFPPQ